MSHYSAPLRDMNFVLTELAGLADIAALPGFGDATADTVASILDAAAEFSGEVLAPINREGDVVGCTLADGKVTTPPGVKQAYRQFVAAGWNGLRFPQEYGGQGLPRVVAAAVFEMLAAANMGFSLCPMLTGGAIEALMLCGSDAQKQRYLPPLIEGRWTGTMNLTEPQAGSDLAAVRTRAVPEGDHFRIYGQKIFITHGEHDLSENIVHLVLARMPDAPPGVKGISLFLVPKFLVMPDGTLGARNDVRCVSIEHKLGIHASPTAVMAYGDAQGAVGYLVGEANRGLESMFVMMNEARGAVGLQGIGIAARAYQQAVRYARERTQGRPVGDRETGAAAIIRHPDVRRMLMTMRALTEAARAVAYVLAAAGDMLHAASDPEERARQQALVDFLTPINKGWATEMTVEVTNTALQVHGGMGYIEETGVAQHLRDARITTIYEGTTGIQANDLVGRKIARDNGRTARAVVAMMRSDLALLAELGSQDDVRVVHEQVTAAVGVLEACVEWVVRNHSVDVQAVYAGATPFLKLAGLVCGGWQMARALRIAQGRLLRGEGDAAFLQAKRATARFYADHLLAQVTGLGQTVMAGAAGTLAFHQDSH
ncbi:acyl-CoA dehydrogenase [Cupriavidus sp. 2TAF22]|uniref:acyl-CoA dehydrogenase n=1 Tax=unclassified Cupriavidus TaxID=2640874 RepID=UPI003F9179F1